MHSNKCRVSRYVIFLFVHGWNIRSAHRLTDRRCRPYASVLRICCSEYVRYQDEEFTVFISFWSRMDRELSTKGEEVWISSY
jgi:hypothetical protein